MSTTATRSSIRTRSNAPAASRSTRSRRSSRTATSNSHCSTRPGTSISPPRPNAHCRCSTMRSSSFPPSTASRGTHRRCSACSDSTRCRPSSSSTKAMRPAPMWSARSRSCAVASVTAASTSRPQMPRMSAHWLRRASRTSRCRANARWTHISKPASSTSNSSASSSPRVACSPSTTAPRCTWTASTHCSAASRTTRASRGIRSASARACSRSPTTRRVDD